jgi:hypothetical protein
MKLEAWLAWIFCVVFAGVSYFSGDMTTTNIFAAAAIVIIACGRKP